ncbi:MAG: PAS domain S-box protein, partial [Kiritimatiellaceae bacterium]|nr:PAS domain S-box protein [Kiritimatiellaceae bacterium]
MSHETKLNGSELLYQLMNNITDHIYFKDKDSRFILVNKSMASKFDLTPEEVLGKTDFDLFALEHARPAFMAEQQMIRTAQPIISLEEKEIWSDGRETWVSTTKMLLRDDSGAVIGTFGISRDITQHKLNEIELHQYSRRLKQINKQMEDEIHMAANLQQVFLPKSYPSFSAASGAAAVEFFHRSIASAQVSGDLCSVKKLSDSSVGLLICDVMGHGIRSG